MTAHLYPPHLSPYLTYKNSRLFLEEVDLSLIAEKYGTPFYAYSRSQISFKFKELTDNLADFSSPLKFHIHYAAKANSNLAILEIMKNLGAGLDIVSGGELYRAKKAGFDSEKIIFSGCGKTEAELCAALDYKIGQINVESISEIIRLSSIMADFEHVQNIMLRINPAIEVGTHDKIATGRDGDKFGISIDEIPEALKVVNDNKKLSLKGLAIHIGSQICDISDYENAFEKLAKLVNELLESGQKITAIDIGGGLGIKTYNYREGLSLESYAKAIKKYFRELGLDIIIEPGRFLIAESGLLITKVSTLKNRENKQIAIIDTAMNDLIRPALYNAEHGIIPIIEPKNSKLYPIDICGAACESGDIFAKERYLPYIKEDTLLAIIDAGAYGSAMASAYNSRDIAAEILVDKEDIRLIRRRISVEDWVAFEQ